MRNNEQLSPYLGEWLSVVRPDVQPEKLTITQAKNELLICHSSTKIYTTPLMIKTSKLLPLLIGQAKTGAIYLSDRYKIIFFRLGNETKKTIIYFKTKP